jgi:hypothetical protein
MQTLAVQYLGSRPKDASPADVRRKLRDAFQRLPISMVLLDWDLPPAMEEAVAEETRRHQAALYRWQTWLTGDANTDLPPEWAVINVDGTPVTGYANDPDFTFICPNHSGVEEFLEERLEAIASRGLFQGIFLDRIRFPSPAANPASHLGCFCRHCQRLAADRGFDLEVDRRHIQSLLKEDQGIVSLCQALLGYPDTENVLLKQVLDFRQSSITHTVEQARKQAASLALQVGLDCFSPTLTRMVGQDLGSLSACSDWVKIMTYPRVFGPAGLSFELLDLLDWLLRSGLDESHALHILEETTGLNLPLSRAGLRKDGLSSASIAREIGRSHDLGLPNPLAGIALVEVPGIHDSTRTQLEADLQASRKATGLVLSWDLWQIPLETLDLVRQVWETS